MLPLVTLRVMGTGEEGDAGTSGVSVPIDSFSSSSRDSVDGVCVAASIVIVAFVMFYCVTESCWDKRKTTPTGRPGGLKHYILFTGQVPDSIRSQISLNFCDITRCHTVRA